MNDRITEKEQIRRDKISATMKGRIPKNIEMIAGWNRGKRKEDYSQLSNSGVKKGNIPWNKGKKGLQVAWNKGLKGFLKGREIAWADKISQGKKNSLKSRAASQKAIERAWKSNIGRKHTEEFRFNRSGERCHFWNGGTSYEPYKVDWTKTLRRSIRERDKYICQMCEKPQGDITHCIHHIDYNKNNCNPDNLVTLCRPCHTKTNFNRDYWINYFKEKNE